VCCLRQGGTILGQTSTRFVAIPFCTSCVRTKGFSLTCMGGVTCVMKRRGG